MLLIRMQSLMCYPKRVILVIYEYVCISDISVLSLAVTLFKDVLLDFLLCELMVIDSGSNFKDVFSKVYTFKEL